MTGHIGSVGFKLTLFSCCFLGLNCSEDGSNGTTKTIDDDIQVAPDILTAATPGVPSAILTDSHRGWAQRECSSCHEGAHKNGFSNAACAHCHGSNGAPLRPQNHKDLGCGDAKCHGDVHGGQFGSDFNTCRSCHEYKAANVECTHKENYDVVIIGAGGGGLGAAAELSSAGMNVLLVEQSFDVGGCMTTFKRGDYTIEGSLFGSDGLGIQFLTQNPRLGLEEKATPLRAEPYIYRAHYPDLQFDVPSDVNAYERKLAELFPDQKEELASLFVELTDFGKVMANTGISFNVVLERHGISNERLISILTRLGSSFGTDPDNIPAGLFSTMWYSMHTFGHYYWEGGSKALANALRDTFLENNGTLKLGTKATKIHIEDGLATQVLTDNGGCYSTSYVVSNANIPDTLLHLVGEEHLPDELIQTVSEKKPGLSAFHVYLGVSHDYTPEFGDTYGIMVSDNYDPWANYNAVEDCDPDNIDYMLVNYTLVDPGSAIPGKNVITINAQLNYDCFEEWGWDTSYDTYNTFKKEAAMKVIERAEELLPNLTDHIEVFEVGTPRTVERFTLNPGGTIFGAAIEPGKFQSPADAANSATPIPNLFLAGAWTTGGGQWVVVQNGVAAAKLVLGEPVK